MATTSSVPLGLGWRGARQVRRRGGCWGGGPWGRYLDLFLWPHPLTVSHHSSCRVQCGVFMAGIITNAACGTMPLHQLLVFRRRKEARNKQRKEWRIKWGRRHVGSSVALSLYQFSISKVSPTSRLLHSCCPFLSHAASSQPFFSLFSSLSYSLFSFSFSAVLSQELVAIRALSKGSYTFRQ